jgi:hypothetical protein
VKPGGAERFAFGSLLFEFPQLDDVVFVAHGKEESHTRLTERTEFKHRHTRITPK